MYSKPFHIDGFTKLDPIVLDRLAILRKPFDMLAGA